MQLIGLTSRDLITVALFANVSTKASSFRVARIRGAEVIPFGPGVILKGQILATLGEATSETSSYKAEVGFQDLKTGKRWAASLHRNGWSHTGLLSRRGGSQLSGPVRSKSTIIFGVSEGLSDRDWPFAVYRHESDSGWSEVGGKPLSDNGGDSQGGTYAVGEDVWAIWNRIETEEIDKDGLAPTQILTAQLNPDGRSFDETTMLWKGRTLVPAKTQIVEYRGDPVYLYMRQWDPKGGLHSTVRFSSSE